MNWYLKVIKQYADFGGRARRKELWMFVLVNMIISNVLLALENVLGITAFNFVDIAMFLGNMPEATAFYLYGNMGFGWLYLIYNVALLLPSFAVGVRRFHDIGKSGWHYLVGLIPLVGVILLLVWFCKDSQAGANKWGANPKEK